MTVTVSVIPLAPGDYRAVVSGEVTFSAEEEEEEEEVEVSIQQDDVSEGVETFTALLSLLPGARLETRAKPQPPLQLFMCTFDMIQCSAAYLLKGFCL